MDSGRGSFGRETFGLDQSTCAPSFLGTGQVRQPTINTTGSDISRLERCISQQAQQLQELTRTLGVMAEKITKLESRHEEALRLTLEQLNSLPTPPLRGEQNIPVPTSNGNDLIHLENLRLSDDTPELIEDAGPSNVRPLASTYIRAQPTPPPNYRSISPAQLRRSEPADREFYTGCSMPPARISLNPRDYDGREPWSVYLRHFEAVSRANGWSTDLKALYLVPYLRGTAHAFYETLPREVQDSFDRLSLAFHGRFSDEYQQSVAHIQLRGRIQRGNESLTEFATDVQRLTYLSFNDTTETVRNRIALGQFVDGIADAETQRRVRDAMPGTLEAALAQAIRIEASRDATRLSRRNMRAPENAYVNRRATRGRNDANQPSGN